MPAIEQRLEAVMTAPLDTLIDPVHRSRAPLDVVRGWHLPEPDRQALADRGLPTDQLMTPSFQTATSPTLIPNVAGPREQKLLTPTDRLYDLGRWGSHDQTPKIGVVHEDGRVLAIRPNPLTAADLHPSLRDHYRDLYQPAVDFINSSVTHLVEISWRWRAAIPILVELTEPPIPSSDEEFNAYVTRRETCHRLVLEGMERIDPAVRADDPETLWGQLVIDV